MTGNPDDANLSPVVGPGMVAPAPVNTQVIPSRVISSGVERAFANLKPEEQDAVAHAHGVVSGSGTPAPAMVSSEPRVVGPPVSNAGARMSDGLVNRTGSVIDGTPSVGSPSVVSASVPASSPPSVSAPSVSSPSFGGLSVSLPPPPTQPTPGEAELARLQKNGAGYKAIQNPFLRGVAGVADTLGSIVAPRIAAQIPGTTLHNQELQAGAEKEATEEQGARKSAADVAHTQAETTGLPVQQDLQRAEARHYISEADALNNPLLKPLAEPVIDPNDPTKTPRIGYSDEHDKTGKVIYGPAVGAKPVAAHEPTNDIEVWMKENPTKNIEDFWKEKATATGEEKAKPLTKETAATLNSAWNSLAPKYHLATDPFRENMSDSEVKHVQDSMNAIVQRNQGAQNITINQTKADTASKNAMDKETSGEFKTLRKGLITDFSAADKQRQAAETAKREIASGPVGQNIGTIKTIVAAAGGQGSGVRVTQSELNSLASKLGPWETFDNFISGIEGNGKYAQPTKDQINQVLDGITKSAQDKENLLNDTIDKMGDAKNVQELRALDKEYRHSVAGSSETAIKKVGTQAEYDALPKGSKYIDSNGVSGTKK